jgi:uncharacterized membrane protein
VSDPLESVLETRFVLGPNASLSVRGAWIFMLWISSATLGAATWCAVHGFWPVLPFAGLELAAVGWALVVSMRRNRYREVVSFERERVRIEFGVTGQGAATEVDLPRAWTRAWIERDAGRRHAPTRLLLGSSGQRVVVGRCLTDEEREALAQRFGTLLKVRRGRLDDRSAHSGMTLGEG